MFRSEMANLREGCEKDSHTLVRPTDSCMLQQEAGEALNPRASEGPKAPVTTGSSSRCPWLRPKPCWLGVPQSTCLQKCPFSCSRGQPHWAQGIFPPAESPCCRCPARGRRQFTHC